MASGSEAPGPARLLLIEVGSVPFMFAVHGMVEPPWFGGLTRPWLGEGQAETGGAGL